MTLFRFTVLGFCFHFFVKQPSSKKEDKKTSKYIFIYILYIYLNYLSNFILFLNSKGMGSHNRAAQIECLVLGRSSLQGFAEFIHSHNGPGEPEV
jgi:hypothetical protein